MIVTLEHVAVTYLVWPLRRKFVGKGISGPHYLKIVWKLSINSPPCQFFHLKECKDLAPLHPVIVVGPFSKWGIDIVHCSPTSAGGHSYANVVVDYFTN